MVVSIVAISLVTTAGPALAAPSLPIGGSLPAQVIAASAAAGTGWRPEPATYGIGQRTDVPVTAADGTVLSADVYYPTNASGRQAAGRFPVLLTQTPYGKGTLGSLPGSEIGRASWRGTV